MGDSRATIKIEFEIYGESYKMDSWINWTVGGEIYEIDDRVTDFLRESYLDAHSKYVWENSKADREREEREKEAKERRELARLTEKYGPSSGNTRDAP